MLSTLNDVSTAVIKQKQNIEGFLAGKLVGQAISPTVTSAQLIDWLYSLDSTDCGEVALFNQTSSLDLAQGEYTVPVSGYYVVGAIITCAVYEIGAITIYGSINVTGSSTFSITDKRGFNSGVPDPKYVMTPSSIVQLQVGDKLTVHVSNLPPGIGGELQECWWGVFRREKLGIAPQVNYSPAVYPVSKILTNYARSSVGFSATISSASITVQGGNPEALTSWDVTGTGNWNSGSFDPTSGIFTVPEAGFYHVTFSVTADFGAININPTIYISVNDVCTILPLLIDKDQDVGTIHFTSPSVLIFLKGEKPGSTDREELQIQMTILPSATYNVTADASWSMRLHQAT